MGSWILIPLSRFIIVSSRMFLIFVLVLEVYLWLGNKYDKVFIEMDNCTVLMQRVCEIIDSILLSKGQRSIFSEMEGAAANS